MSQKCRGLTGACQHLDQWHTALNVTPGRIMCGGHDLSCLINLLRWSHRRFRIGHRAWIEANESRVSFTGFSMRVAIELRFLFFSVRHRFHNWKIFYFLNIIPALIIVRFIIDFLINFYSAIIGSKFQDLVNSISWFIRYFDIKIFPLFF